MRRCPSRRLAGQFALYKPPQGLLRTQCATPDSTTVNHDESNDDVQAGFARKRVCACLERRGENPAVCQPGRSANARPAFGEPAANYARDHAGLRGSGFPRQEFQAGAVASGFVEPARFKDVAFQVTAKREISRWHFVYCRRRGIFRGTCAASAVAAQDFLAGGCQRQESRQPDRRPHHEGTESGSDQSPVQFPHHVETMGDQEQIGNAAELPRKRRHLCVASHQRHRPFQSDVTPA